MEHAMRFPFARRTYGRVLSALFIAGCAAYQLQAQEAPAKTEPQSPPPAQAPANESSEVSTRDTPPTFRVRVNLVLVRDVVRDNAGKVVRNLKKEDFLLSDNRKPQVISTFSAETPESHKLAVTTLTAPAVEPGGEAAPLSAPVAALPQRFVALMFDDTNMLLEDT